MLRTTHWAPNASAASVMKAGLATDCWKRTVHSYVESADLLLRSMRDSGFLSLHAIPIDPQRELLGGAHRLACAIALGLPSVSVERVPTYAWAPPWHREWFVEHGMPAPDLARLDDDWELIRQGRS